MYESHLLELWDKMIIAGVDATFGVEKKKARIEFRLVRDWTALPL